MTDQLSPQQRKVLRQKRAPYRHAMDRLIERHFPSLDDDGAEMMIETMTTLARGAYIQHIGPLRTAKIIKRETDESVIVELDMFEDRKKILVVYNPKADVLRTVLP